jgi:quinol monooxygenase YgiN
MAEHASVVRVIRFRTAPEKQDGLVERLQSGIDGIRQMEGCFGAQVCSVREDPNVTAVISRWASQAAFDQFLSNTASQRADLAATLSEPPSTETYVAI